MLGQRAHKITAVENRQTHLGTKVKRRLSRVTYLAHESALGPKRWLALVAGRLLARGKARYGPAQCLSEEQSSKLWGEAGGADRRKRN